MGRRILTQFARDVVPETSLDAHLNVGEVALERADEEPRRLNELLRRRWLRRLVRDRRRIIRRCGNGLLALNERTRAKPLTDVRGRSSSR
jgi:hypothetical protein